MADTFLHRGSVPNKRACILLDRFEVKLLVIYDWPLSLCLPTMNPYSVPGKGKLYAGKAISATCIGMAPPFEGEPDKI